MGGLGAPDDLSLAPVTQAWLAVSDQPAATVTGGYFYHQRPRDVNPVARSAEVQDGLLSQCAGHAGVALPTLERSGQPRRSGSWLTASVIGRIFGR